MDRETYNKIEAFMYHHMKDSAHDLLHIYRVLYQALIISKSYDEVNKDVLITSCLLHDIGRQKQYSDNKICHAIEGGKMAYEFLNNLGYDEQFCSHVRNCIVSHRFRTDSCPETLEAKILFDSDKLDVTGSLGIARSLMYIGLVGEPLYTVNENNDVQDGSDPNSPQSFFKEYHYKLSKLYDKFYTEEAAEISQKRKRITEDFYEELVSEVDIGNLNKLLALE